MAGQQGLRQLEGVGAKTVEDLNSLGVTGIEGLAKSTIDDLDSVFSESKAERLIQRAKDRALLVQTGSEHIQERKSRDKLPTGLSELDQLLEGGFTEGDVVGVAGGSDTGKTQLCFKTLGQATLDTGHHHLYIETEQNNYSAERIASLSANSDEEYKKVIDNSLLITATDLDQQLSAYRRAIKIPKQVDGVEGLSCVVIDSFSALFRLAEKYNSRGELKARSAAIGEHLRTIGQMAEELQCPVLMALQGYGNPSGYGSGTVTWGGELLMHTLSYKVKMKEAKGDWKRVQFTGASDLPEKEVFIRFTDDGRIIARNDV